MAIIKPFKGMRFTDNAGKIKDVCCPPYDIISDEQRKKFIKKNSNNIIRLELPGKKAGCYKKAGETLDKWLNEEVLALDSEAAFYIYQEDFNVDGKDYSLRGFIGRCFLYDFSEGIVLPHEETLSKAKEDRFQLMKATQSNFSQVYSLYDDKNNKVNNILNKYTKKDPVKSFTDTDGVTHSLWIIPKSDDTDKISTYMAGKNLYIADGHHRYETAVRYRNYLRDENVIDNSGLSDADYIMMMLVDMNSSGLVVFPTHRIIHSLEKFSKSKVISACKEYFDVKAISSVDNATKKLQDDYNKGKKSFCMYDGKKYNVMTLKSDKIMKEFLPDCSDALQNLDVSILHTLVLENIMNINKEDMANGTNLTYTRDINEAVEAVDNGEANCSFILNPTRVEEISAIATANEKMPQKSTYFYPKLITGMVMNKFTEFHNDEEDKGLD